MEINLFDSEMASKRDKISNHPMLYVRVELGRLFVGNGREECAIIAIRFSQRYKYISRIQFSGVHVRAIRSTSLLLLLLLQLLLPLLVLQRYYSFLQDKDATTNRVSHTSAARFYSETHYTSADK